MVQDRAGKLSDTDRAALINQAITQRYSFDAPREVVADVAGAGSSDLSLPADFEDGFSVIRQLEYPIGDVPPATIESDAWSFYRTPNALKIRLVDAAPAAIENLRVTFTARHKSDGSTVRDADFEAVCDYAAALCFEALAAAYVQVGDASIAADSVNYRTKSQEYLSLAKGARKRYLDHMGITDGSSNDAVVRPAIATGELDQLGGGGVDRLTHGKATR